MGGITFVNGPEWRRNRLVAQKCLSRPEFLARAEEITAMCSRRLLASWRESGLVASGSHVAPAVDMGKEMSKLAIDVIGHLCWSTNLGAIDGDHDRFFLPVHTMLDAIQAYLYLPLPAPALSFLPTPTLLALRAAVRTLRDTGDALMAPRFRNVHTRESLAQHRAESECKRTAGSEAKDVLDYLLAELTVDPSAPTKEELDSVVATLMDLLGAGHDTTANALSFCLGLLAQPKHRVWQDRVAGVGRRGSHASSCPSGRLPIDEDADAATMAAYRETLRLFPLGAAFSRVATSDVNLDREMNLRAQQGEAEGDVCIAKGVEVLVSPYAMGRDSLEWDRVDAFSPDRFLNSPRNTCPSSSSTSDKKNNTHKNTSNQTKNKGKRSLAYTPYGGGRRYCVGVQFAEVFGRVVLRQLLGDVSMTLEQGDTEIKASLLFTMRPREPLMMRLRDRAKSTS